MPFPDPAGSAGASAVSRQKSPLMVPPRVALKVPGRVRGPGLVAGLRAEPAGCFLLFFIGIGAAFFLFGLAGTVGPYRDSLRENGDPRFFLGAMAFGTVFILVAARMLQIVLTGTQHRVERRYRRGPAERPWEWDYPWKPERMAPDYSGNVGGTILGRVAFLALIGLFNIALGAPSLVMRGIVLLFDLFGLLILYDSVVSLWQGLRFRRRPWVSWKSFPAFLGGTLEATVGFPSPPRPTGPVKATLRCVRDEWVMRPKLENKQPHKELEACSVYAERREIPLPGAPGEPLARLEVSFDLPRDQRPTDLSRDEACYWQLVVEVPVTGPDYSTVFLAPVYRR